MQFQFSTVQGILNRGIDKKKNNSNDDDDGEPLVAGTDHRRSETGAQLSCGILTTRAAEWTFLTFTFIKCF
jgi:hypothetical protein